MCLLLCTGPIGAFIQLAELVAHIAYVVEGHVPQNLGISRNSSTHPRPRCSIFFYGYMGHIIFTHMDRITNDITFFMHLL